MHPIWFAIEGSKGMLTLYNACFKDLSNALLQSSKRHTFISKKYHGVGPTIDTLYKKARQGNSPTPNGATRMVDKGVNGIAMHQEPTIGAIM